MAILLSTALIQAKNAIETDNAWLICLDLNSPDGNTEFHLVHNTEDVTVNGQLYQAFPFEIDELVENSTGGIGQFSLKVSNIDRVIQSYIEQDPTFGSGWDCKISVYYTGSEIAEIEHNFVSLNVTCDIENATFTIGVDNPILAIFPSLKFNTNLCSWTFKDGVTCPYSGDDTECFKTLEACKQKFPDYKTRVNANGEKIGLPINIFMGIPSRAIYV